MLSHAFNIVRLHKLPGEHQTGFIYLIYLYNTNAVNLIQYLEVLKRNIKATVHPYNLTMY